MNKELAEAFTVAIEEIALEHAKEVGFDMETERHALFRMMMAVFTKKELRDRAIFRMGKLSQTTFVEEGEDHEDSGKDSDAEYGKDSKRDAS